MKYNGNHKSVFSGYSRNYWMLKIEIIKYILISFIFKNRLQTLYTVQRVIVIDLRCGQGWRKCHGINGNTKTN